MSSGSRDKPRYSRTTFVGFAVNMLPLELMTWVVLVGAPFFIPLCLPVIGINALIGWALARRAGHIAQLGRGLLIASLAPVVTLVIFIPGWIVTR